MLIVPDTGGGGGGGGAAASSDTSITVANTTGSNIYFNGLLVHVWRNVDQTTPLDVTTTTATTGGSNNPNPPAITPVTAGAIILAAGVGFSSPGQTVFSSSDLSNFLSVHDDNGFGGGDAALGSHAWSGSGSFDPAQWTSSTNRSNFPSAMATMALRPATGQSLAYVGGNSAHDSSGTSHTVSLTALTGGIESFARVGDIIVVAYGHESTALHTLSFSTAGYTTLANIVGTNNPDRAQLLLGYKLAA